MTGSPPYPSDTRARGYRLELDYERILQSDTWALASPRQRPIVLMVLFTAWQQTPCGSLPADPQLIAARLGINAEQLAADSAVVLRGWVAADDGRLYHPVMTEIVTEMIHRKGREASRKAEYRARLKSQSVQQVSHGTSSGLTRPSGGSDDTGTCTGKRQHTCTNPDGFARFWSAYPRKRSKGTAEKAWRKLSPDDALADVIIGAVEVASQRDDWRRDGGKYIPYPATWLNAKGWEDAADTTSVKTEYGAVQDIFRGAL